MSLVENLIRNYTQDGGSFRVEIPRWEIADHGITALIGPSGAGKTSVFRILIGLDACPTLKWNFSGQDLAKLKTPERRLGVVFQGLELFPHMTAKENVYFAARARELPPTEAESFYNELSLVLSLKNFEHRKVQILSGGEKQRVALARALIGRPRFLFLDEPFSALDADLRDEARKLVKTVIARYQIPTLIITHDPEDLKNLADHVQRIRHGQLVNN
jgi:ABC-type sulfate/molybdate transport systems ATPase subunit